MIFSSKFPGNPGYYFYMDIECPGEVGIAYCWKKNEQEWFQVMGYGERQVMLGFKKFLRWGESISFPKQIEGES